MTDVFDQKLRTKLMLRILLTAAAILVCLAIATFVITRSMLAGAVTDKARVDVALATAKIDAWLHEKGEVVSGLAAREVIAPLPDDSRKGHFHDLAAGYGGVGSVYMGFADGRFVTGSSFVPPADYDPRKRPWYVAAVARNGLAFSAPYRDADTNKLVVSIAAPVVRAGHVDAVIAMDITVDDILTAVQQLRRDGASWAYVVDETGRVVAHPEAQRVLATTVTDGPDGALFAGYHGGHREDVALFVPDDYVTLSLVKTTGWTVILHVPSSAVTGPLRTLALVFGFGIVAALVVLGFTVAVISTRIVRPLLRLVEGAREVASGTYDRRIPVESHDEVGYLSQSFNEMAAGLKDREFIKSVFGRYVSPDVMREILDGHIALGGEAKVITIMFSDIRGFTSISEKMEPHALVQLLNHYFTAMDGAISRHRGSINKYLGDGILALFGAPVPSAASARDATEAALEMQRELDAFNEAHQTSLRIGIGVHTGVAVVGNIGSEQRTEYTVIGDAVNLASRIEHLTTVYGLPILISEDAAAQLGDGFLLRIVDRVRVKGKTTPITLLAPYARASLADADADRIERSNVALQEYLRGDFEAALRLLGEVVDPDRHHEVIAERCRRCVTSRPATWDGVWTMDAK